jgi:hypothetical protein
VGGTCSQKGESGEGGGGGRSDVLASRLVHSVKCSLRESESRLVRSVKCSLRESESRLVHSVKCCISSNCLALPPFVVLYQYKLFMTHADFMFEKTKAGDAARLHPSKRAKVVEFVLV